MFFDLNSFTSSQCFLKCSFFVNELLVNVENSSLNLANQHYALVVFYRTNEGVSAAIGVIE